MSYYKPNRKYWLIAMYVFTIVLMIAAVVAWYLGFKGCMEVFDSVLYCVFK